MIYGYARVSTEGQDLEGQIERLNTAGCAKVFFEKRSGIDRDRPQLRRMIRSVKAGDTVIAVVTDRLARDPLDLLDILKRIENQGAALRLLDEPFIDTTSELSDLVLFLVGWAAKWQRRRILENTAAGRARARAVGVKFGRKPKLTATQRQDALACFAAGESALAIAGRYGVSTSTIYRTKRSKEV